MKTTQETNVSMEDLAELSGGDRRELWQRVRAGGLDLEQLNTVTGGNRRIMYQRLRNALLKTVS